MNTCAKEWIVHLAETHPQYKEVILKLPDGYYDSFEVVVIDSAKLMAYTANGHPNMVILPVNQWEPEKQKGLFDYLKPPGAVPMPQISFVEHDIVIKTRKWLLFPKKQWTKQQIVGYINGRHRARYMHDAGATSFPVFCHHSQAKSLIQHCGVEAS